MAKRIVNVGARSPACRLQTFAFRRCLRRFVRYTAVNFALSRSRGPPDLRVYVVGFAFGSSSVVTKGRGFIGGRFVGFGRNSSPSSRRNATIRLELRRDRCQE